ncbi:MAG: hypothetical protein NTZ51_11700 [Proteobacteria bacterium]|nr:hypothetical protein [Pseudomonadota bacterium]
MAHLRDIHTVALAEIKRKFSLNQVSLKYPFPERARRTLGLVKVDGEVYSSEQFSRVVLLKIDFPFYLAVRSTFLRPRIELDLPVFSCEAVIMGEKRMFMADIHRAGDEGKHDDTVLFNRMLKIRDRYPSLLKESGAVKGEIQSVFSKAACQARITEDKDDDALGIFREYLNLFLDLTEKTTPLSGAVLDQAKNDFEKYLKTVVDHDPGVKGYKVLFGKESGVTRALDIFFDR